MYIRGKVFFAKKKNERGTKAGSCLDLNGKGKGNIYTATLVPGKMKMKKRGR